MTELVQHRVLAALRFIDANSGLLVNNGLTVSAPGLQIVRNRLGLYALLANRTGAPPAPTLELTVTDRGGAYWERRFILALPRDGDPEHSAAADSLFQPVDILLFRRPTALAPPDWALIRATVVDDSGRPLPAALLRVQRTIDGVPTTVAQALTAWQGHTVGEATLGVPGIPVAISNDGDGDNGDGGDDDGGDDDAPVMIFEVPAVLDVVVDPTFAAASLPDPDFLIANRATLPAATVNIHLRRGQTLTTTLTVAIA